ncbi:DUF2637 domain-containing protein [Lentzea albidocapillata]|uniref:DUF2637 domain-containing protein n=1 Tax=Lentzea albidocapillata TaxID=40571 RepID=A0A1W2EN95_9PSEU|nr:DUF2637 domain-containing protein [Lentzea albidocapillata]SMD11173.1 Protein of unknown function [Lentzea albidocapillata]
MNEPTIWIKRTCVVAVAAVAAVAAVVSFDHMRALASDAGEGWKAWILPISVDGMLVSASLVMLTRKRAGQPVGALAWIGLVLGLLVSLAANVAAAEPTLIGRLVAAWPPVALGLSYELLLTLIRETATVHELSDQRVVEAASIVHEQQAPLPEAPPKRSRKLLRDYVNEAREHLGPDVNITPAWVREVTNCSRGLSPKIAATLRAGVQ